MSWSSNKCLHVARHHRGNESESQHAFLALYYLTLFSITCRISASSASCCFSYISTEFLRAYMGLTSCPFFLCPPLMGFLVFTHSHSPTLSWPTSTPLGLHSVPIPAHSLPHPGPKDRDHIIHFPCSHTFRDSPSPLGKISWYAYIYLFIF